MKQLVLLPLLLVLIGGCDPVENFPKASTSSGSSGSTLMSANVLLKPENWRFAIGDVGSQGNPNAYQQTLTTTSSNPGLTFPISTTGVGGLSSKATSYTLGMATAVLKDTASYCYWAYGLYPPTNLRIGQSVTLTAKVKLQQVQGKGVSLVIRGDKGSKTGVLLATTEGRTSIRGTADATQYSVTLPYTTAVDTLMVYLVLLSNTSGSASFSDVTVEVR